MQHGHEHAAWTWTCSIDMDMQHGIGHASWTWTCSMDMDIHAAWTLPVGKSSEFKSGEYGGQSAKNQNSGTAANWSRRRRPSYFPSGYVPLAAGDHMLSQKLLVDVGVDTFVGEKMKGVFSVRLRPFGCGGPHAVSKALGRCQHWHVRQQKPMFCGYIPPLSIPILRRWTDEGSKIWVRHSLGFCLQNAPGVEVKRVQVWWIWQPIRQNPECR